MTVYAILDDGTRGYLLTVSADFDLQTWAESRRDAFKLLRIVRLVTEELR